MQADPHAEIDGGGQLAHQFGGASVAVNLAARVQQAAPAGATWVSSTVRDLLLGGEWTFSERGEHALKGHRRRVAVVRADRANRSAPPAARH